MATGLTQEWRGRLPAHGYLDLDGGFDEFPELREAVTPPEFGLRLVDTSFVAAEGDQDVTARVAAELIPPADLYVAPGAQGWVDVELATSDDIGLVQTLDIPTGLQMAGLGSLVIAQLAGLGDRLGLAALELEAGKLGRWAWMRCGFDFGEDEDRDRVVEAAARFAVRLDRAFEPDRIRHSWDFMDLDEPVTTGEITAAGGPEIEGDAPAVPLGRALLLGPLENENTWFGRLTLDAQNAGRVRLQSYVS